MKKIRFCNHKCYLEYQFKYLTCINWPGETMDLCKFNISIGNTNRCTDSTSIPAGKNKRLRIKMKMELEPKSKVWMLITSMSTLLHKKKPNLDIALSRHGMLKICRILFSSLTEQWWSTTFDSRDSSSRCIHDALLHNRILPLSISKLWLIHSCHLTKQVWKLKKKIPCPYLL